MPTFRFLFFSSKQCSRHAANLLPRLGPTKTIQSCGYAKASRHCNAKRNGVPVIPIQPQEPRSWGIYVIPASVLAFVGLATYVHYNDERRAVPKGQGIKSETVTFKGPNIGGPFTLMDTENRKVTERNLLGNWVLLYFGYTSSPDVGPEQVQVMAKAIDILESKEHVKVLPVFVTIDPQRDTPSHLRAYLKEFDSRILGLTGSASAIRQMAQEYRIYFRKIEEDGDDYLVELSHNMYLINPKMEVARCFGVEYNPKELSEAILKEIKSSS